MLSRILRYSSLPVPLSDPTPPTSRTRTRQNPSSVKSRLDDGRFLFRLRRLQHVTVARVADDKAAWPVPLGGAHLRGRGPGVLLDYEPAGRRLITSTCQVHIIFGGVGQEDAAWVSSRLGTATVIGRTANAGRQRGELLVGQGGNTRGETGRPLLTPEEIQQLPEGWMILNGYHARPALVRAVPWYKVGALKRLAARANARRRRAERAPVARGPEWEMRRDRELTTVSPRAVPAVPLATSATAATVLEEQQEEPARSPEALVTTEIPLASAPRTSPEPRSTPPVAQAATARRESRPTVRGDRSATPPRAPRAKAPAKERGARPRITVPDDDPFATATQDADT